MSRTVKRIIIKANEIEVEGQSNNAKNYYRLNSTLTPEDIININKIKEDHNFFGNKYDANIIRALSDQARQYTEVENNLINEEQLDYYFSLCSNKIKAKDIPIKMPEEIIYNIDKKMTMEEQFSLYTKAKDTQKLLQTSKVRIKMGVLQKAYMLVQKLLNSSKEEPQQALNPGTEKTHFREDLYNEDNRKRVEEISKSHSNAQVSKNEPEKQKDQELTQ